MIQEDKRLLLVDLCSRLPYGVKCRCQHIQYIENGTIIDINMFGRVNIDGRIKDICDVKPYLFPMSSMADEQEKEYINTCNGFCTYYWTTETFDWLNKYHFDYRGLIEKGLAIDATNLYIY